MAVAAKLGMIATVDGDPLRIRREEVAANACTLGRRYTVVGAHNLGHRKAGRGQVDPPGMRCPQKYEPRRLLRRRMRKTRRDLAPAGVPDQERRATLASRAQCAARPLKDHLACRAAKGRSARDFDDDRVEACKSQFTSKGA